MKTIKRQLNQLEQRKRTIRQASYFKGFYEVGNKKLTPEEFIKQHTQFNNLVAYVNRDEVPQHIAMNKNLIILDEQDYNL